MQIKHISVSRVTQLDKYLRLIRTFDNRIVKLSELGHLDVCREIQYHLDQFKFVYDMGDPETIESEYKEAYKHLVHAYGWSCKAHLERLGEERPTYVNNGGSFVNNFMKMCEQGQRNQQA